MKLIFDWRDEMNNIDIVGIFLLSWFGSGFLTMIIFWISEMRGKEFNENYFDTVHIGLSFVIFLVGYLSLGVACCIYCHNNRLFTKLIYRISNIGIKKRKRK